MCCRWRPFQTHAFTDTNTREERQRWRGWNMYVWGWEARGEREASAGSFGFKQNHQLHPTSASIWACCFSAAAAQPAGEEGGLFVVLQPERWKGFFTAYQTCFFSFDTAKALSITLDGVDNVMSAGISILFLQIWHQIWCKVRKRWIWIHWNNQHVTLHHKYLLR